MIDDREQSYAPHVSSKGVDVSRPYIYNSIIRLVSEFATKPIQSFASYLCHLL